MFVNLRDRKKLCVIAKCLKIFDRYDFPGMNKYSIWLEKKFKPRKLGRPKRRK